MTSNFRMFLLSPAAFVVLFAYAGQPAAPQRVTLSAGEMHRIVGGAGVSTTGIPFPQNFVTSDFDAHKVKYNEAGNRCQYNCGTFGPTNVGFDVGTMIIQVAGLGAPRLEVYADGQGRAFTNGTLFGTVNGFELYSASLTTRCKGGANNNKQCNTNSFCTATGGICTACNQDGVCNGDGIGADDLLPCARICKGDTSGTNINGKICTSNGECGNGACVSAIETGAQTCYLLGRCGTGTSGGLCTEDCTTNGAKSNGDSATPYAGGAMHSAFVRTLAGNGFELVRDETIFQMVSTNSTTATTCDGPPE